MGPNNRQSRREALAGRRKHWPPSAGGLSTRLAYARAETAGVALDPILSKVGLTRQQVKDPASRIKVHDQIRFLSLVADALSDDLFGFHLAQATDLREIGLFYYVLASSETLLEALQKAAELEPKNPSGYQLLATYYWEKAYKDHRLTSPQKKEYIARGLEATDKALALNSEYADALTYKNLLLRMQGNEETDLAKRAALYKQADELREKAIELNKARQSQPGAKPGAKPSK